MYTKINMINNIEFIDMTDKDKFIYLMKSLNLSNF